MIIRMGVVVVVVIVKYFVFRRDEGTSVNGLLTTITGIVLGEKTIVDQIIFI